MLVPVAEAAIVSFLLDAPDPDLVQGWAQLVFSKAGVLLKVTVAAVATFLIISGPKLPSLVQQLERAAQENRWGHWILLHCATVVVSAFVASRVLATIATGDDPGITKIVGFASALLGAGVFWLLAIAPVHFWQMFTKTHWRSLVAAVMVGLLTWFGGLLAQNFWEPLATGTFLIAYSVLDAIGVAISYIESEKILETHSFAVRIAPSCSGYEGIALVSAFVSLYLWFFRRSLRFPAALLLLPVGIVSIWLLNAFRIVALVLLGTYVSPDVAISGFHSNAGWIGFVAVSLALIALSHRLEFFSLHRHDDRPGDHVGLALALILPFLVLLLAKLVTAALTVDVNWLYPVVAVATGFALWHGRRAYLPLIAGWSWFSVGIGSLVFIVWHFTATGTAGALKVPDVAAGVTASAVLAWVAFRVIGFVVLVPLAEELAFRGYLLRKLVSQRFEAIPVGTFTWLSFILSSLLFGLLHERWIAGTFAGAAFALATYRRGNLGDAVAAHATANLLIAITALASGRLDF